ncbi:MAG: nucleotidyltransferase domain-containing protein [Candidatus Margulisbacteria bacterium]|jgi:predicted nucleotidyltransferase|nr:nucleotidyltransferase domain-containing protein [Candidatus Margulisiibacteriota bacterium]
MVTETAELKRIVKVIVSAAAPDKIILFGSRARGDHRPDSDYDFLIIKKRLRNERKLTRRLHQTFYDHKDIFVPIDLIAVNQAKYNRLKGDIGYIYKTIDREGKILYEE